MRISIAMGRVGLGLGRRLKHAHRLLDALHREKVPGMSFYCLFSLCRVLLLAVFLRVSLSSICHALMSVVCVCCIPFG